MAVITDSKHIITITPDYVAFNYRGRGCYRVNDCPRTSNEKDIILHGYSLLTEYFSFFFDSPDVLRAVKEVDEQISWIGQGELF